MSNDEVAALVASEMASGDTAAAQSACKSLIVRATQNWATHEGACHRCSSPYHNAPTEANMYVQRCTALLLHV